MKNHLVTECVAALQQGADLLARLDNRQYSATNGLPGRLVATLADVQERRSAQERERLSSSLFQNLHEGLVIVDAELRILEVNPTYCRITGAPREELLGTVPQLLSSSSTDAITRQQQSAIWAGLRGQGHWSGEVVERRRNGDPCALHVSIFTVHDPEGAVRYRDSPRLLARPPL